MDLRSVPEPREVAVVGDEEALDLHGDVVVGVEGGERGLQELVLQPQEVRSARGGRRLQAALERVLQGADLLGGQGRVALPLLRAPELRGEGERVSGQQEAGVAAGAWKGSQGRTKGKSRSVIEVAEEWGERSECHRYCDLILKLICPHVGKQGEKVNI